MATLLAALFFLVSGFAYAQECPRPVVLVVGTRPEAIKMLPCYFALKQEGVSLLLVSTGQHTELLDAVMRLFRVAPDVDFGIGKENQDLFDITLGVLTQAKELFQQVQPSLVMVQGDTTSAMAAALAAFYLKIPVAHVEAGLRTTNRHEPFPEEVNRRLISLIASYHFAPTAAAAARLMAEGISSQTIFCTGNPGVDALYAVQERLHRNELFPSPELEETIVKERSLERKLLLLTVHRRESFDGSLVRIFRAVRSALENHPSLAIVYPVHPNPRIQSALVQAELEKSPRLHRMPPLSYADLVYLLERVDGVITDSGGIQEEAATLHKRVLVVRKETDRPEALDEWSAQMAGVEEERILEGIRNMLFERKQETRSGPSPYGDGRASLRIAKIVKEVLKEQSCIDGF